MVGYLLEVCFSHSVHQPNYCQPVYDNSEILMLKFCLRIEDDETDFENLIFGYGYFCTIC